MEIEESAHALQLITSKKQLNILRFNLDNFSKVFLLYFYAKWHKQSIELLTNIKAFAEFHQDMVICAIEADE